MATRRSGERDGYRSILLADGVEKGNFVFGEAFEELTDLLGFEAGRAPGVFLERAAGVIVAIGQA